ncbi:hypothetical protein P0082_10370 [Candidatus Haliotispira prima]|uniref:Uncharacterized protein n=1 Tax=Candidatus Haliotispira prima TaxID=3034016 RepID=A0ABY8MI49_9SPIO|nr:hypothetical protein P0082_10370 [Candidatus Haliotispira prima]
MENQDKMLKNIGINSRISNIQYPISNIQYPISLKNSYLFLALLYYYKSFYSLFLYLSFFLFLPILGVSLLACAPLPDTGDPPAAQPPAAANLNASMAWVSMREGLVQFDNGTEGARTIGVIVSKDATAPVYTNVKDLPGFYTRKTKADGTARTVYLSMTDKMTIAKFNANVTVSVDGGAAGFVSAIDSVPELLHPNTGYYAHFYETTGTAGTAIEKLEFTTGKFPTTYPTSRGTYSNFYNQIAAGSSSPTMEYKTSENYLIPLRYHYFLTAGGPYAFRFSTRPPYEMGETSINMRPFETTIPPILIYDVYNITPSGPGTSVTLWDGMIKIGTLDETSRIDILLGGDEYLSYDNKKAVLVTE